MSDPTVLLRDAAALCEELSRRLQSLGALLHAAADAQPRRRGAPGSINYDKATGKVDYVPMNIAQIIQDVRRESASGTGRPAPAAARSRSNARQARKPRSSRALRRRPK